MLRAHTSLPPSPFPPQDVSGGQQDAAYRDNVYLCALRSHPPPPPLAHAASHPLSPLPAPVLGDQGGTNRRKSKGAHDKTAETDWVLVEHAVAVLFEARPSAVEPHRSPPRPNSLLSPPQTLSFLPRARKEQIARDLAAGAGMRNRLTGGLLATDNSAPLRSAARAQIRRDIFSVQVDALLQDYAGTLDSPHPPQPIAHDREDAFEVRIVPGGRAFERVLPGRRPPHPSPPHSPPRRLPPGRLSRGRCHGHPGQ